MVYYCMTDITLHNTLTRKKEKFTPIDPNHVRMYVCGPTVYNYAHIGNARPPVVFDTLRRILEHKYPKVTHVANITDIDDKIIDAAKKTGVPISDITKKYTKIYNDDMAAVGVRVPHIQPLATDHVDGMISMIQTLIDKNNAYEKDGHVLFNVPSYPNYGLLSGRNRDEQIAGARVEIAPYKQDPADFVLWKPSTDEQPGWDSPWGYGRPGWHIECSVMARDFLGDVFDIHGGGLDLTFPHHENEMAQSCCASGQSDFAKYWVHNGFVTVEGEKMSKSIGNVLTVHDMINDGVLGEAMRLNLLSTHYRQPMNWTQSGLEQSLKTLDKWYDAMDGEDPASDEFITALYDDINTPLAISILHDLAKNKPSTLKQSAKLLGLLSHTPAEWRALRQKITARKGGIDESNIETLIAQRNQARLDKDFNRSDAIRDQLTDMGIVLKDNPDGSTTWSHK